MVNDHYVLIDQFNSFNTIKIEKIKSHIFTEKYNIKIISKPRTLPQLGKIQVKRAEWKFENSLFAGYDFDNETVLKKCFDEDWKRARIERLAKDSS